jgi:glyoxylate carboligase
MATAHAKFTGEVGVCMATSGPGAIHLLNGLYDAKAITCPSWGSSDKRPRARSERATSRKLIGFGDDSAYRVHGMLSAVTEAA